MSRVVVIGLDGWEWSMVDRLAAENVEHDVDARAAGQPTVPSTLAEELATNPFLRTDDPAIQAAVGLPGGDPVAVFAALRAAKDTF